MSASGGPRPFTVHVPAGILQDLRERLVRIRWPDEAPGAGWTRMPRGGHCAALEAPDLAGDVRAFSRALR